MFEAPMKPSGRRFSFAALLPPCCCLLLLPAIRHHPAGTTARPPLKGYIEEGGLTGERKRWVPRERKISLDTDVAGFVYKNPLETSFRQQCLETWRRYHKKVLRALRRRGPSLLGDATESNYARVLEWLFHVLKRPNKNALKPKAASKMLVPELIEELEAQGLPTDGNRSVLYQRVQKARRINRSRNKPLWVILEGQFMLFYNTNKQK